MQTQNNTGAYANISNLDVYVGAAETIIIEANVLGYSSFGLSISTSTGSTISSINVYASADDINYYTVTLNAIITIASGIVKQYTFTHVNKYLRVTATSAGTSAVDCYLIGVS